jgi:hypothetical protein
VSCTTSPRRARLDVLGQSAVAVGADHQIHVGRLLAQVAAQVLGHAARDAQDHALAGVLVLGQHAGAAAHALDRALSHRAGVDENHVGPGRILGARVPGLRQQAEHHVGVGHIHLAAIGFNVNRGHRAFL